MRGDRFGCDQALPGCDSARLSQQLRLVTAADVLLCSTTRESPHTHTHTHTHTHPCIPNHTLLSTCARTRVVHTQMPPPPCLLLSVLLTHCDHSVAGSARKMPRQPPRSLAHNPMNNGTLVLSKRFWNIKRKSGVKTCFSFFFSLFFDVISGRSRLQRRCSPTGSPSSFTNSSRSVQGAALCVFPCRNKSVLCFIKHLN